MKKIGYMGFNERMILEVLENENCQLNFVITQKDRLSKTMLKLLDILNIPCYMVENKEDLLQYKKQYDEVDFILAHCFGVIVPKELIEKYECFNIHTGNLRTNRGPYPIVRNILNEDEEATLTLHRMGKKIDTGVIIGEYRVPISKNDDNITLADKLDQGLKQLLQNLIDYNEEKNYPVVEDGVYYKKVSEKDIFITKDDTYEDMERKIRAQKSYGGALAEYKGYIVRISKILS